MSLLHFLLLVFFIFVSAALPVYTLAYMHLLALARGYRRESVPRLDGLPNVTVQLPIYNERYVVERLIHSVCSLDYPREKLQIIVADDSDDDTSEICARLVEEYSRKGFNIIHLKRAGRQDFKAGALQNALSKSTGEFIAIFDADFVPPRNFLRKTLPYFSDPSVGLVQVRWGHLNREYSLLTRAQALALDLHFSVEQRGRDAAGLFLNFNGTAGVWRRSCIEDAGGWFPSLAEDIDLSYRAQLRGWRLVYIDELEAPAEIPVQINAARRQQYRWAFGAIQTTVRYLKHVLQAKIPPLARFHAFIHLTRHLAQLLLTVQVMMVPLVIRSGILQQSHSILVFMSLYPVTVTLSLLLLAPVFLRKTFGGMSDFLKDVFMLIIWGTGTSVNNSIAVVHAFFRGDISFERTPKYGIVGRGGDWKGLMYVPPFHWLALADILIGLYSLYGSLYAFYSRAYYFLPLTTLFSASHLCVGFATIAHRKPAKSPMAKPHPFLGKLIIITLAVVTVPAAVTSYASKAYPMELAVGLLVNASTAAEMDDSLTYVDRALKLIPDQGNPVWILPTPLTELRHIRNDLEHIKNRLESAIKLEGDVELYHATYEDSRRALLNIAGQLRYSMPYAWLGPVELAVILLTLYAITMVLVRS
ncbi:glycosyl transferase family 2 [Candidatus Caldarchaeum subterraneum]|uniref:Glycosyl transferase family 2 n=1 Tax=Caldiarchaeum subterraneum TaxID=311458 RepID=E6N7A9_CALS0|nr:glycosyl transferase family 2 [Candidatus Caldarchaeum subterraneum]BAJ50961.1 glycosyl transferase family 2 [Candidatus Caldarchaeum subterraneum]